MRGVWRTLPHLLADEFAMSRSEARRVIAQGGVAINGRKIGTDEIDIDERQLQGSHIRVGRRRELQL